jgi:opacity protein-like surface antigen
MKFAKTLFLAFTLALFASPLAAQVFIDVEGGAAYTASNDVRIPGDTGTRFSLSDDLQADRVGFFRLRAGYTFGERHTISLLYAPLQVKAEGRVNQAIDFRDETFAANTQLYASYTFNSYRLTYRYALYQGETLHFGLGLTGKIRDAEIEVSNTPISTVETNVGFVPLINFRLDWALHPDLVLRFAGDALAGSRGRAEDVLLALGYNVSDQWQVRAGYRLLEGGADSDKTYNFALIHYASLGLTYRFAI